MARSWWILAASCLLTGLPGGRASDAGDPCLYDNYRPLDDGGAPTSQQDVRASFFAEAADDFVLSGEPGLMCHLDEVRFGVVYLSTPFCEDPDPNTQWHELRVTIYEDISAGGNPGGDPGCEIETGPAGYPIGALPGTHIECFGGGVVCELTVPMSQVTAIPLPTSCITNAFDVHVTGLNGMCELQSDHLYWIGIAPKVPLAACGEIGFMLAGNSVGHPAMWIIPELALKPWTVIDGNDDLCPPDTPTAGSVRDLSIMIRATAEINGCRWDLSRDGDVGPADLAILLGQWGDPYGPEELALLLGHWGPCKKPTA